MKKRPFLTNNVKSAVVCIVLIAIITAISASPFGWTVKKETVQSVALKDVYVIQQEGQPNYPLPSKQVMTITVSSSFIPRQYELPYVQACLYNSDLKVGRDLGANWDTQGETSGLRELVPSTNTLEVFNTAKTAVLKVQPNVFYRTNGPQPVAAPEKQAVPQEPEVYDRLFLFLQDPGKTYAYKPCFDLQRTDIDNAISILVTR